MGIHTSLVSHFWRAGISAPRDQRDAENLPAMRAGHSPRVLIGIHDVRFFYPKQFRTLRALSDKHRHREPLGNLAIRMHLV